MDFGNMLKKWIRYEDGTAEPVRRGQSLYDKERGNGVPDWWVVDKPLDWMPEKDGISFVENHPSRGGKVPAYAWTQDKSPLQKGDRGMEQAAEQPKTKDQDWKKLISLDSVDEWQRTRAQPWIMDERGAIESVSVPGFPAKDSFSRMGGLFGGGIGRQQTPTESGGKGQITLEQAVDWTRQVADPWLDESGKKYFDLGRTLLTGGGARPQLDKGSGLNDLLFLQGMEEKGRTEIAPLQSWRTLNTSEAGEMPQRGLEQKQNQAVAGTQNKARAPEKIQDNPEDVYPWELNPSILLSRTVEYALKNRVFSKPGSKSTIKPLPPLAPGMQPTGDWASDARKLEQIERRAGVDVEAVEKKYHPQSDGSPMWMNASVMGSLDYYRKRAEDYERRNPGKKAPAYYREYGDKYVRKFDTLKKELSPAGQAWVERTKRLLQLYMEDGIRSGVWDENNPEEFKALAFDSHSKAYLDAGLRDLPKEDWGKIMSNVSLKDFIKPESLLEVADVFPTMSLEAGQRTGNWIVDQLEGLMGGL